MSSALARDYSFSPMPQGALENEEPYRVGPTLQQEECFLFPHVISHYQKTASYVRQLLLCNQVQCSREMGSSGPSAATIR